MLTTKVRKTCRTGFFTTRQDLVLPCMSYGRDNNTPAIFICLKSLGSDGETILSDQFVANCKSCLNGRCLRVLAAFISHPSHASFRGSLTASTLPNSPSHHRAHRARGTGSRLSIPSSHNPKDGIVSHYHPKMWSRDARKQNVISAE